MFTNSSSGNITWANTGDNAVVTGTRVKKTYTETSDVDNLKKN
jgi:hypothetical protein